MKRWLPLCFLLLGFVGLLAPLAAADDDGFRPIFDGKTLEGWDGNPAFWRVEDGSIVGETTPDNPTKGNTFLIWRGGQPGDFELKVEYRMRNHNSGIQFRSWEEPDNWGKWVIGGYQADIDGEPFTGILYGERYRGILAQRGQKTVIGEDHKPKVVGSVGDSKELLAKVDLDGWNEFHIVAQGNHITQSINGHTMVEVTDNDVEQRRADGLIAMQLHAGPPMKIEFRSIRLKEDKAVQEMKGPAKKKIAFVAGRPSHGYAGHEHYAGCMLLAKCLEEAMPEQIETVVYKHAWPEDPAVLADVDAIVLFSDGGGGNPIIPHLDEVAPLMKKGVGLVCLHYAVETPKDRSGECLKEWIGGYFEPHWSVNPHWTAEFKQYPDHPTARGLKPFAIDDEWYYHMRFKDDMEGVTPILSAIPPDATRERPDGAHSGNPTVRARKGMAEHLGWVVERPDGGRGMGFTGGHWHWNWACDSFRAFVLNGIVWSAGLEVPEGGVPSKTPTLEELKVNQDYPAPANFDFERVEKLIEGWNR